MVLLVSLSKDAYFFLNTKTDLKKKKISRSELGTLDVKSNSLLGLEKHRAAVHVFPLLLRNQFGTRLWAEVAVVAALL